MAGGGERSCTSSLLFCGLKTYERTIEDAQCAFFRTEIGGWMRELVQDVQSVPIELSILQAFNYSVFPLFWAGVEVNYFDSKTHLITILLQYLEASGGQAVVRNYIKWKTLFFHLAYVKPNCREGYLWSIVEIYSGPPHLRKEFCIMRASGIFPLSLPSVLRKIDGVKRSRDVVSNKALVKKISGDIKEEYHRILDASRILDNVTAPMALQKLDNISVLVSYPDKIDNEMAMESESDRISTELFWSMVFGASAVYREKIKRLRKPVNPSVMSYASVGSIIGHEITHAFDDQGKLHGPTGNLGRDWWSVESRRRFKDRERCYIEQYVRLTGSDDDSEARNSLYENIADNVGLEVALKAWQAKGEDSFRKLAGLDLNAIQVFFVSYAQSWCALKSKQQRGVHMLEKTRFLMPQEMHGKFDTVWIENYKKMYAILVNPFVTRSPIDGILY
ncbi:peptidase family M13 [Teladorsagia circumcincta]|uniref:Peptidase family M13 n=1 Tax=Teladorsagia circumcincta TaxID=45464 RepID=A0A2G9U846_TELCI|nr:peptidase family M13 [Teladorsagia circumcincta]